MNCYYHPDKEATDVCPVCSKPICTECYDTLLDRTICRRCKSKVAGKVQEKLVEQQSEQRIIAYVLPVASFFFGITFLLVGFALSSEMGSFNFFHIISLIVITIGVIAFLVTYLVRREERYIKEEKPTLRKKIGWILLVFSVLPWVVLPAAGLLVYIGGLATMTIIVLSLILLITGLKLAKW